MELDYDLVIELQSQLCFTLTSHHMFTIKNADDTGDGLFPRGALLQWRW